MNNPPPVNAAFDADGNRPASIWVAWVQALFSFIGGLTDYTKANVQTPVNAFSITLGNKDTSLILTPAGALAAGTVTMPAIPYDGQPIEVSSTQAITALTVAANTGQTIKNAPTTLSAGVGFKYFYRLTAATWYRLY